MSKVTPIIGLEIHVELATKSKMFCGCPASFFGKEPNTQTCPVCLGLPGALPVANRKAIEDTIMIGLALNCEINEQSRFDRKQYFYPDLSKGYQISQYEKPLAKEGYITLLSGKRVGVERVHLEEDTGKLKHKQIDGEKVSLIDFNRSGVPLVEIVSKPDMSSAEEAKEYLKTIRRTIEWLGVSSADMEKGQMRLEPTVNVEVVNDKGTFYTPLVEIKNINSFNFAYQAIEYEIKRQVKQWKQDGVVKGSGNKQTRGYDSDERETFLQRQKEEASDYRYFPEPDIPPMRFGSDFVKKMDSKMPFLPSEAVESLRKAGVRDGYINVVVDDKSMYKYVKSLLVAGKEVGVDADKLVGMVVNKRVNWRRKKAEEVIREIRQDQNSEEVSEEETMGWVKDVLKSNPEAVKDYQSGKETALKFLLGQVMGASKGQADPQLVSQLLKKELVE